MITVNRGKILKKLSDIWHISDNVRGTYDPIFTHDLIIWPATVASNTLRILGLTLQRGADLTVRAWRRPCCVQRCFLRHVSGSSFREKSFRKKEASCHCAEVANSDWCAKLFAGFSIIIIPFRCVSIWIWNFRLGFVGHFVSVGCHALSQLSEGSKVASHSKKTIFDTKSMNLLTSMRSFWTSLAGILCCFLRFGWNKA